MTRGQIGSLWDVHLHLPAYDDPEEVVRGCVRRGLRAVCVTVSPSEVSRALALRDANPSTIRCFIGVHPSEATTTEGALEDLSRLWEKADGVGEVGLDPKYSEVAPGSPQMRLFEAQVEVASRLRKPLQVHSREAERECLDILDGFDVKSLLMHWFEGEEILGRVLARPRTFVSFGPAILYSRKLLRIAKRCPPEAVLAESDGPVRFSALGGAEGPGLVPSVAFKLAELWGKSLDEAVARLALNAEAYLG